MIKFKYFMKKQTIWVLGLVLGLICGAFVFWQYDLYKKFSITATSCRGDWSYNVKCPFGSYCRSLDQGSLAGGLCEPVFFILFDVFGKSDVTSPPQIDKKIIASEVTVEGCQIKITTTQGETFLDTNFLEFNPQTKCYQFVMNIVSSSGKYLVFQDISGGVDSMLKVYSIEYNDTVQLDVFGTSNIFDIFFLPDDTLVSLYGYNGLYNEQYLKVFNLPELFATYPSNIEKQYKYFTNLAQYSKIINLPDIGKDYYSLSIAGDKLQILGTAGTSTGIFKEYSFDELWQ